MKELSCKGGLTLTLVLLLCGGCSKSRITGPPHQVSKVSRGELRFLPYPTLSGQREIPHKDAIAQFETLGAPPGVSQDLFDKLKAELEGYLLEKDMEKLTSAPRTADPNNQIYLYELGSDLLWKEARQGDWNNDGIVSANDITPIALHFGESSDWGEAKYVDGNGDRVVNAGDLEAIALHFGESTGGYNIYEADDQYGLGRREVASITRPAVHPLKMPVRTLRYDTEKGEVSPPGWMPAVSKWYQVVPYDQGETPRESSTLVSNWARFPGLQQWSEDPYNTVSLSSGPGYLIWNEARQGDWNNDGRVTASDSSLIAFNFGMLTNDPNYSYLAYVDGNRNGVIDVPDAYPIDEHLGESTGGYNIYETDDRFGTLMRKVAFVLRPDPSNYPNNPPLNVTLATVQYNTSTQEIDPEGWVPTEGKWYRVVPFAVLQGEERPSTVSNWLKY